MEFLWLIFVVSSASAEPKNLSLFYQTEKQVREIGGYDCTQAPLGEKIRDVRALCGAPVAAWKEFSLSLIALPGERESESKFEALKAVVERNTYITEGYAQLYLLSRKSVPACGRSLLPWVGGASLGSLKSGQVMRSGLSANLGGVEAFDEVEDANYRPRFRRLFGLLDRYALESATVALGEGNKAIFADLYWQLLAGATCGASAVVNTIESTAGWESDPKLSLSLRSWKQLAEAERSCDPETIIQANKGFVEVEQFLVGQQAMYEGLQRSLGGWALSPLVEPAIPAVLGKFPTFTEHARRRVPLPMVNFANVHQRVSWMQDQLAVMEEEFGKKSDLLEPVFCSAAKDSERVRKLLLDMPGR